ncbi:MAG: hypothetical protein HC911_12995 [Chloroflexaceae bacterium]|nr:hypothetical protein [Chloroflexaceae bacterium]
MSFDYYAEKKPITLRDLKEKDKGRLWQEKRRSFTKKTQALLGALGLHSYEAVVQHIATLPPYSFALHIPITLTSPYLSRDDELFYIIENPVRKERVFGVPYVAASGWKGALRAALWQQLGKDGFEQCDSVERLFGKESKSSAGHNEGQVGSLYLYPTFFDRPPKLEIINPHERQTGIGKNPILMECVPTGAQGALTLLYVPLAVPARPTDVAADLRLLVDGLLDMLTVYGFGAKTSSGYGTATLDGKGKVAIHASLPEAAAPASVEETPTASERGAARYLDAAGNLSPVFRQSDGSLKSEAEYEAAIKREKKYSKQDKQLYDKAKKWWEREGRAAWEQRTSEAEQAPAPPEEPEPPAAPAPTHTATFATAEELRQQAKRIAAALEGHTQ